ncbi:MAG: alpha/beta hydrolase [Luteolibacter sp.]
MMKRSRKIVALLSVLAMALGAAVPTFAQAAADSPSVSYGNNESVGRFAELNGIKLYYETYGEGEPLLQLHANGGDIESMRPQLDFFATHYRVIAPDSRGHGKSEIGKGDLTYEQMAEDMNALLDQIGVKQVNILGWSDGGIVGLLLAIHHPEKVKKLAIMGANLNPNGAYDWAIATVSKQEKLIDALIAKGDESAPWETYKQHLGLMVRQPNMTLEQLKTIQAPTLVMAADKDVIRDDHTLEMFHALPNAHLCIFPGATHMIPREDSELFNQTVERFFSKAFTRPDTKKLFEKMTE